MATSPSHRFGQVIGDMLEEIMIPYLEDFCSARNLYLDKKGSRGEAREGKKVSWEDKFGNSHDLDFVIEAGGTANQKGRPLAFIEAAWRRYTKHSRNKAQEIQGAILPIAEKHAWDKPFLGAVLAGAFTSGSLNQMRSSGFEVALFPYEKIVESFAAIGIDARFDEDTPDHVFLDTVQIIEALPEARRGELKAHLIESNRAALEAFLLEFQATLDRGIELVIVIPLHGQPNEFATIPRAISFVEGYKENSESGASFRKYEVVVRYTNQDKIDATFQEKHKTIDFLHYIEGGLRQPVLPRP